jgi:hypothetical protein
MKINRAALRSYNSRSSSISDPIILVSLAGRQPVAGSLALARADYPRPYNIRLLLVVLSCNGYYPVPLFDNWFGAEDDHCMGILTLPMKFNVQFHVRVL